eukprot:gene7594-9338_t
MNLLFTQQDNYIFPLNKIFKDPFFKYPPKYSVCLPQKDHYIVERQQNLEWKQFTYNFNHKNQVTGYDDVLEDLPPSFKFMPPTYQLPEAERLNNTKFLPHGLSLLTSNIQGLFNSFISNNKKEETIASVEDYQKFINLPNNPKIIEKYSTEELNHFKWLTDEEFGRQRIQGLNAGQLIKLNTAIVQEKKILEKLQYQDNKMTLEKILLHYTNRNFETALADNLLYCVDYNILDDKDYFESAIKFGRYTSSPLALFYVVPETGKLYPLCIKILQNDPESPVFTPLSTKYEWIYAKLWFQSADGQHMEFVTHLWESHLLSEVFVIATHRQLSERHPVYQLLHPHFSLLLDINWRARGHLLAKDGPIDVLLGPGALGALRLVSKHNKDFKWNENTFIKRLEKNNTLNDEVLKNYFYKEDGLRVYAILKDFVTKVLEEFYPERERDIERDFELHAWIDELQSKWGGQMKGIIEGPVLRHIEELAELVTDIIFRMTVEHSIGNHGQWDMYGFTPNVPGALYTIDPRKIRKGMSIDLETIIDSLPPKKETLHQIAITHLLSNTDTGLPTIYESKYEFEGFSSKLGFISEQFRNQLYQISQVIDQRNSLVEIPYNYINPNKVCGSIFI